jgi:hypothetical protein
MMAREANVDVGRMKIEIGPNATRNRVMLIFGVKLDGVGFKPEDARAIGRRLVEVANELSPPGTADSVIIVPRGAGS